MKGAAMFEAKFQDAMNATTLRKFSSPSGPRRSSASDSGGPRCGIGGSGTCSR